MNRKITTLYLVLLALFSALVCVLTVFVQIPVGMGYVNFGDTLIFLASSLLGPFGGAIVGALGSSLADIFSGWVIYAPFTAVIKGAEGFLCGLLYEKAFKKARPFVRRLLSTLLAGLTIIFGYFITDWILFGFSASLYNFISGPAQVGASVVIAMIVLPRIPELFLHDHIYHKKENNNDDKGNTDSQ